MITTNAIIEITGEDGKYLVRVLGSFSSMSDDVWLMPLTAEDNEWPKLERLVDLQCSIADGTAHVVNEGDPYIYIRTISDDKISEADRNKREKYWDVYKQYKEGAKIFYPNTRDAILNEIASILQITTKTARKYLRRAMKIGFVPNAFLPFKHKFGAPGTKKTQDPNRKMGPYTKADIRKGKTEKSGVTVTPVVQAQFLNAYNRVFLTDRKRNDMDAIKWVWSQYYSTGVKPNDLGIKVPQLLPPDQRPTIRQYRYWKRGHTNPEIASRKRYGNAFVNANQRPLPGSVWDFAEFPGQIAVIDATDVPIALCRSEDRNRVIGMIKLYSIVDMNTFYIMGVYGTFEGESYATIATALAVAFSSKKEEYGRFDHPVHEEESISYVSDGVLTDGALAYLKDDLARAGRDLNFDVHTSRPRGPESKGPGEAIHEMIYRNIIRKLSGAFPRDRIYGEENPGYNARFTFKELMQLIIHYVLEHNRTYLLEKYPRTPYMVQNALLPTPLNIIRAHRITSGALRTEIDDVIRLTLLPRGTASITRSGIVFHRDTLLYDSQLANQRGWLYEAGQTGTRQVEVAYHPSYSDVIYLCPDLSLDIKKFERCDLSLSARMNPYRGLTFKEVDQILDENEDQSRIYRQIQDQANIDMDATIAHVNRQAEQAYRATDDGSRKSARTKNKPENRQKEIDYQHTQNRSGLFDPSSRMEPQIPSASEGIDPNTNIERPSTGKKVKKIWEQKGGNQNGEN